VALGCGRPGGKILPDGPAPGSPGQRGPHGPVFPAAKRRWLRALSGRRIAVVASGGSGATAAVIGAMQAPDELGVKPALMSLCSGSAFFGLPLAAERSLSTRRASSPGSGRRTTSTSTGAGPRPSGRAPTRGSAARASTASSWIRARGWRTCAPGGASALETLRELREARSGDEQHRTPAAMPHLVAHAAQQ
jgi:hypothetical protein